MSFKTNEAGIKLIKSFESLHDGDLSKIGLQPKMCPAGVWTEGWGHAIIYRGKQLKGAYNKEVAYLVAQVKTEEDADRLLADDLISREEYVQRVVTVPINENQFSALVSLVFNIGEGNFNRSPVLKKLNQGDYIGAAESFKKHNRSNGRVLNGLIRRREAERVLFVTPTYNIKDAIARIDALSTPLPPQPIRII